ncbi:hypothetical protein DB41_DQ00070 [Neochlamydia sp. TUME1]|nr:hypothetical protein DB41_DQ00070 [Neochlamydia sp. TUME1]
MSKKKHFWHGQKSLQTLQAVYYVFFKESSIHPKKGLAKS